MKAIKTVLVLLLSVWAVCAEARNVSKQTLCYANKDGNELNMDIYSAADTLQPCVIYLFGGGFVGGTRDDKSALPYYDFLVSEGFKVVAIDYRLGLKPLARKDAPKVSATGFRSMLVNSVDMAAEDLLDATAYVISHAAELGIDPSKILTCGSSAGAITVYQAEYYICNGHKYASVLPAGFNYAGVIGFAGAILERSGRFAWKQAPCPMMLFHGNADSNVPYGRMSLLGQSFYGSERIARSLTELDSPYWFYDANNVDHSLASTPRYLQREEIMIFVRRMALGGNRLIVHQTVDDTARAETKHRFSIKDYIKSNFSTSEPEHQ